MLIIISIKGSCGESTAKKVGVTRAEQDEFAVSSYKRSANAWKVSEFTNIISFQKIY